MDVVGVVPFLPAEHVLHVAHEVPSNVLESWYCPLSQFEQTRSTDFVGELPFFPTIRAGGSFESGGALERACRAV